MEWNKETFKQLCFLVAFGVLLYLGIEHFDVVISVLGTILSLIFPFILGGCMAFILNVPMRAIEKALFSRVKNQSRRVRRLKRVVSLFLTLALIIGIVFLVVVFVVPELWRTIITIGNEIPGFVRETQAWAEETLKKYPELVSWIAQLQFDWKSMWQNLITFVGNGAGNILNSTVSLATGIVSGVTTMIIAFVFSIYILVQKETLGRQGKMVIYAFSKKPVAERLIRIFSLTHRTFANFLTGQCVEAVILGCMFVVSMGLLKMPYALLIGVLIAFTALIPIFGAFIGCVIGIFLILMESPVQAAVFLILFLVLQQIEGNLIYPRVVGSSVNLPSIWVLAAVSVGGSLMGIAGMLIFIPIVSVIYALFSEHVKHKVTEKGIKVPVNQEPLDEGPQGIFGKLKQLRRTGKEKKNKSKGMEEKTEQNRQNRK